jgi:hypothetical protein
MTLHNLHIEVETTYAYENFMRRRQDVRSVHVVVARNAWNLWATGRRPEWMRRSEPAPLPLTFDW